MPDLGRVRRIVIEIPAVGVESQRVLQDQLGIIGRFLGDRHTPDIDLRSGAFRRKIPFGKRCMVRIGADDRGNVSRRRTAAHIAGRGRAAACKASAAVGVKGDQNARFPAGVQRHVRIDGKAVILVGGKFGAVRIVIPFAAEHRARGIAHRSLSLRDDPEHIPHSHIIAVGLMLAAFPKVSLRVGVQRDRRSGKRAAVKGGILLRLVIPGIHSLAAVVGVQVPVPVEYAAVIGVYGRSLNALSGLDFDDIYALLVFRKDAAFDDESDRIGIGSEIGLR